MRFVALCPSAGCSANEEKLRRVECLQSRASSSCRSPPRLPPSTEQRNRASSPRPLRSVSWLSRALQPQHDRTDDVSTQNFDICTVGFCGLRPRPRDRRAGRSRQPARCRRRHRCGAGVTYRLVGFDAPEQGSRAKCSGEAALAERATSRLRSIVAAGGLDLARVACACRATTEGTPSCNYGRLCATLRTSGQDVADIMIREGLAHPLVCGPTRCPRREPWC